jgi:hypothetical protein
MCLQFSWIENRDCAPGQIESAPAVTLPSADSLVEVFNQPRQMNEVADIRVSLAEARMA